MVSESKGPENISGWFWAQSNPSAITYTCNVPIYWLAATAKRGRLNLALDR